MRDKKLMQPSQYIYLKISQKLFESKTFNVRFWFPCLSPYEISVH